MITVLNSTPSNMVGFRATGKVTMDDFENVVIPAVNELVARNNELNYLMVIDTDLKNFTIGAWWQDAFMGLKQIAKWRRAAIVSGVEGIKKFTNIFSFIAPGEFKAFDPSELETAIHWVSEKKHTSNSEAHK